MQFYGTASALATQRKTRLQGASAFYGRLCVGGRVLAGSGLETPSVYMGESELPPIPPLTADAYGRQNDDQAERNDHFHETSSL